MSYNKFLNNKVSGPDGFLSYSSVLIKLNRDSSDYFFNKSDLNKMEHFINLIQHYKLCNKTYYYYDTKSKLWIEERTDDSVINRICEETINILEPEKKFVIELLLEARNKLSIEDKNKFDEINESIKEFNKFIDKTIKEHQKVKFARSVLSFFHHQISDPDFMDKININNHHLLPLKMDNLNLKTMKMEERRKEQYFTKCLDTKNLYEGIDENNENFQKVDKFFLDICSGHEAKKQYVQKILGYFLSGAVPLGRCFFIFYGNGKNGKSALIEIIQEIMGSFYCKSVETSILIKKGSKGAGQASPELEVLDYGLRLGLLSETDDGDKLNESLIKNITGYDSISYRPLYGKQKQLKAEAKLCMLTNNKPYFKLSTSMIDRLRFIDFKSRFLNDHELTKEKAYKDDGTLKEFFYKAEPERVIELKTFLKDYVLLWMAIGAKKFYEDKHLNIPDDKLLQTENMSYINELDSIQRFIDESCVIDENEKVLVSVVKDAYNKFCTDENIPAVKPSQLRDTLSKKFEIQKKQNNYYFGFKLKDVEEEESTSNKFGLD
jgi:P4 family phage/plasmid primase-like protien